MFDFTQSIASTTNGGNAHVNKEVAIKFRLHRRTGVEVHRVYGTYTMGELQAAVQTWWSAGKLRWSYTDPEDNDTVTLTSELEWAGCLEVHRRLGTNAIRIDVTRPHGHKQDKSAKHTKADTTKCVDAEENCCSDAEADQTAEQDVPSPTKSEEHKPENTEAAVNAPIEVLAATIVSNDGTEAPVVKEAPRSVSDAGRSLLELMFGTDVVRRLYTGDVDGRLRHVCRVVRSHWDCTVDINFAELARLASGTACGAIESRHYEVARDILTHALALPVERNDIAVTLRYNLACAYALLGACDEAMKHLADAVAFGYTNHAHMRIDEDLAALHDRDDFKALTGAVDATDKTKPEIETKPVTPSDPKVETLLSIFPGISHEAATDILAHARGDLNRAVAMFLGH